jgi:hypothetical protein
LGCGAKARNLVKGAAAIKPLVRAFVQVM